MHNFPLSPDKETAEEGNSGFCMLKTTRSLCQGEDTGWQGSKSTLLLPSSRILVIVRRRCIDRLPRPSATHTHNNHRQQQHQAQKRRRGRGLPNLPGSPPLPSSRVAPPCGRPPIVHVSRSFSLLRSFSHMLHGYGLLAPVRTQTDDGVAYHTYNIVTYHSCPPFSAGLHISCMQVSVKHVLQVVNCY